VGGGITSVDHIKELMHCGADKISLNHSALVKPRLITDAALLFGDQCVVVSIDAVKTEKGYRVYDYVNKLMLDKSPGQLAKEVQSMGAGEILINSVDKDGSYTGYDISLINAVCNEVSVPVICCGGAKNAADFVRVFTETNVSAASAANFFHFTEHSVNITKASIIQSIPIRLETHADYGDNNLDNDYRLLKKADTALEEMLFLRIEKEII
jgi:cyclase